MAFKIIPSVYYTAAFANTIGVLIFTKGLTNQTLINSHPTLFSQFGIIMVMVWGLCYLACTQAAQVQKRISLIFALEKCVYLISWVLLLQSDFDWESLYQQDVLAGLFYSIYGVVDGIYMLLFLYCAYTVHKTKSSH